MDDTVENLYEMKKNKNLDIFKDNAYPSSGYMPVDINKLNKFVSIEMIIGNVTNGHYKV